MGHIVKAPGQPARVARINLPVWMLVSSRRLGITDARLLRYHPGLTPAALRAAWAYNREHRAEIGKDIETYDEEDPLALRRLRPAVLAERGVRLLDTKRGRRHGRRQVWDLVRYREPDGSRCRAYLVLIWWSGRLTFEEPFFTRQEARAYFDAWGRGPDCGPKALRFPDEG